MNKSVNMSEATVPISMQSPLHLRGTIINSTFKLYKERCTFFMHKCESKAHDADEWAKKEDKDIPQIVYWVISFLYDRMQTISYVLTNYSLSGPHGRLPNQLHIQCQRHGYFAERMAGKKAIPCERWLLGAIVAEQGWGDGFD